MKPSKPIWPASTPISLSTVAFGQILSQPVLDIPRLGVVNVHASLLPAYRGANPIQWAVLNGDTTTGITTMKTDIGVDTGDMLLTSTTPIEENESHRHRSPTAQQLRWPLTSRNPSAAL